MKNKLKKSLSVVLAVAMIFGLAPLNGFVGLDLPKWIDFGKIFQVEAAAESYSGTCGNKLAWSLDTETGILVITGSGAMTDYSYFSPAPWDSYRLSIESLSLPAGLTSIGEYAFYGCSNLISVTIPDSVTGIGDFAFYGCKNLASVTIPDSVTSIDGAAFRDCSNLTSVTIPDSVTSIDDFTFYNCESLTSVIIPDSVTSIGHSAFYGCKNLASVTIPDSVTSIFQFAFNGCKSLTDVYYNGTEEEWNQITISLFNDYLLNATIHFLGPACEHEYTTEITKVATCKETGETTYTCSLCGDSYTEKIHALAHTPGETVKENEKNATCTIGNSYDTVVYCTVCDGEIIRETITGSDALGHTEAEAVEEDRTEPTCTENGSYNSVIYCSACEEELSRETKSIPVTGHHFGAWKTTTEPTMTETGVKTRTCSECGATETGEVPATGITITLTDSKGNVVNETVVEGDTTEFAFADLEDGKYTVTVKKETYASREYTVNATDGTASVEFKLNKMGDMNGDGKINAIDVARANAHAKGVSALSDYDLACVDVNGDGRVNAIDVALINAHSKGTKALW